MKAAIFGIFASLLLVGNVYAEEKDEGESGSNLPRMVSLRSDHINARSGPGARYPIDWIYMQKGAPVEIIAEFELWRKIKDWEGSETWVHKSMLSGKRTAKIISPGEVNVYAKPDYRSKVTAKAEEGSVGTLEKCPSDIDLCKMKFDRSIEGWVSRTNLFGLYDKEEVK